MTSAQQQQLVWTDVVVDSSAGPTRNKRSTTTRSRKAKDPNHVPRPPNAFILFRSAFIKSQHIGHAVETNHSTLSKIIGMTWQSLPEDERQEWHLKARSEMESHKVKFPNYAFEPQHSKRNSGDAAPKRKVREVQQKDLVRCAKIAELVTQGYTGTDLEEAVLEFDKTHVPEIVTRFEAPITASMFEEKLKKPSKKSSFSSPPRRSPPQYYSPHSPSPPPLPATPACPYEMAMPSCTPIQNNFAAYVDTPSDLPQLVDPACFFSSLAEYDSLINNFSAAYNNTSCTATTTTTTTACSATAPYEMLNDYFYSSTGGHSYNTCSTPVEYSNVYQY